MSNSLRFRNVDVEKLIQGFDEKTKQEVYEFIETSLPKFNRLIFISKSKRVDSIRNLFNYIQTIYNDANNEKNMMGANREHSPSSENLPKYFKGIYTDYPNEGIHEKHLISKSYQYAKKILKYSSGGGNKSAAKSIIGSMLYLNSDRVSYEELDIRYAQLLKLAEITKIEDITEKVDKSKGQSGHQQLKDERDTFKPNRIAEAVRERNEEHEQYSKDVKEREEKHNKEKGKLEQDNERRIKELKQKQQEELETLLLRQQQEAEELKQECSDKVATIEEKYNVSKKSEETNHRNIMGVIRDRARSKLIR